MNQTAKEIIRCGLFDAHSQQEESGIFLAMMGRLAELISQGLGAQQVCRALLRIIIEETGVENCSLLRWDAQNDSLSLVVAGGLENLFRENTVREYNRSLSFSAGEGMAGRAFSKKYPVFIQDSTLEAIPFKAGAVVRPTSLVSVPLLDFGVLNMSSFHPQKFTTQIRCFWEHFGKIVGGFLRGVFPRGGNEKGCQDGFKVLRYPGGQPGNDDRALDDSSILTQDALQYIPQGVCLLNDEGKVVKVNHRIEQDYGRSGSELIGRSPAVIFRDPGMFETLLERVGVSPAEEMADVPLVNTEGKVYSADVNLVRMTRNDTLKGYLLVINDVSKKKAFAEKMLQAEKLAALGTMAGGVAHDFNNLLMVILGNVQLVLPQIQDEETTRRLRNIEKAVHDGANTVRRLQKFTESNRHLHSAVNAADVNEAIKDVIEMTRPRWKNAMEKTGHTIQFRMDLGLDCHSKIHISDLREGLTNLVLNAIEAMPEGGTIAFRSRLLDDAVLIKVADTGVGMTQELAARVFDPFYTTKGIGNSGLGLSVTWSLITRAGGEIQVISRPGKGSRFTIRLPKADPPEKASCVLDMGRSSIRPRLLVVDDDEEILGIVRDMLRFRGYGVVAAADGEKALEIIEREEFDLVLTDLGMPGVNGWDVARTAKEKNPELPVILLTGWGAQYEEENLHDRGVDLVLSKPLSWEKLTETINKLL